MKNIFLVLTSVLLNAIAQILMRKGMLQIGEVSLVSSFPETASKMITSLFLWLSIFCYGMSVLIWMTVLSRVEVSFAYAFSSLGYVFVIVMSLFILKEHISAMRIIGAGIICFGIILVSGS
ncbi:MAG: EamA family transporter [Treponema sp.]|nr:EamA family transporter [Treponema sp.]